ncbi:MAG: hypothetical protein COB59_08225 [Rhodospirillaceae bacterium]|nr:MAG: hypothetical protein COB59_08225 [Rhodospirillaceae bacterium]
MIAKILFTIGFIVFLGVSAVSADETNGGALHLTEKSIHDDTWWHPEYKEAVSNRDCVTVMSILNRAQKAGNIRAHNLLGEFYWDGICVGKDAQKAEHFYRYGAERGKPWGAANLAQIRYIEKGENDSLAIEWANRARYSMMDRGIKSWKKLFPFLHPNAPLSPHLKQALVWLEKRENDDANALFKIGKDFLNNSTWPESKVLACYWLRTAETKGHIRASYLRARQYLLGEGVLISKLAGVNALHQAMRGEDIDAYLLAAQIMEQGRVVNQSYYYAYFALIRAQGLGAEVTEAIQRVAAHLDKVQLIDVSRDERDKSRHPRVYYTHGPTVSSCLYSS